MQSVPESIRPLLARAHAAMTGPSDDKVVCAMSGGVDSAVAAYILKTRGHDVVGVTLRLAPDPVGDAAPKGGRCCSIDDMTDARAVSDRIGIPFYAIDARDRFRDAVVKPFVDAYRRGETPIPCAECNHVVKFGDLVETARGLNARLATGHYARLVSFAGATAIARPFDDDRDQTYYLYGTDPSVVASLLFPLSPLKKPEVREIARAIGLTVSEKPDSQEICFVPDGNHARIVEKIGGAVPAGNIVDLDGKVVGTHDGVHNFTVGQRRGTGVAGGRRLYVVDIDADRAQVTMGDRDALATTRLFARNARFIVDKTHIPETVLAQVRARQTPAKARVAFLDDNSFTLEFENPIDAVAPGQAAVLYVDDVLIGGGVIDRRLDGARPRTLPVLGENSSAPHSPDAR